MVLDYFLPSPCPFEYKAYTIYMLGTLALIVIINYLEICQVACVDSV